MMTVKISSLEYGPLLSAGLPGRLVSLGVPFDLSCGSFTVPVTEKTAEAAASFILSDMRPLELIRLSELLPKELRDDGRIVLRAEELTRGCAELRRVSEAAFAYMEQWEELIIEGFLRFRLKFLLDEWAAALDRAAEELSFFRLF